MRTNIGPAGCDECVAYVKRRAEILEPHIEAKAERENGLVSLTWLEYMRGVHKRHLAGLSIEVPS